MSLSFCRFAFSIIRLGGHCDYKRRDGKNVAVNPANYACRNQCQRRVRAQTPVRRAEIEAKNGRSHEDLGVESTHREGERNCTSWRSPLKILIGPILQRSRTPMQDSEARADPRESLGKDWRPLRSGGKSKFRRSVKKAPIVETIPPATDSPSPISAAASSDAPDGAFSGRHLPLGQRPDLACELEGLGSAEIERTMWLFADGARQAKPRKGVIGHGTNVSRYSGRRRSQVGSRARDRRSQIQGISAFRTNTSTTNPRPRTKASSILIARSCFCWLSMLLVTTASTSSFKSDRHASICLALYSICPRFAAKLLTTPMRQSVEKTNTSMLSNGLRCPYVMKK